MMAVRQWLDSLGFGRYADVFEENAIEWDLLKKLSDEDLKEIGVALLGHRKRILEAAAALEAPAAPVHQTASSGDAERRQLTVMFCDLVGSTALAAQMDPEEYREVLAAYQSVAKRIIDRYDGYIARYMGDGLLVYSGYPQAHEDDPERAVRAGLDMVQAVRALQLPGEMELKVRIGIATGLVVVGDIVGEGASEERAVLGETPNLAARLQGIAEPNTVVLADSTRRLVKGRFALEALTPKVLKGIEDPVTAYRAAGVQEASRFDAAASSQLTRLRGREHELEMLETQWERARRGEGQVVLFSGEPGIGKSRLAQELRQRIGEGASAVLHYQCSPYHMGSAFHPLIEQLQREAGFERDDSVQVRQEKLEALVERTIPGYESARPLLADLLSLPSDLYSPLAMTPEKHKIETVRLLVGQLEHQAAGGSLLMLFEDAHWCDPSTREVLDAVIGRVQSLAVLMLITYRPEFSPPWSDLEHVTTQSLDRLGRHDVGGLVESVTGGAALPPEVIEHIIVKADGVPLYAEELTKSVLEGGFRDEYPGEHTLSSGSRQFAVPSTLQDSLMARLDRLALAKDVAQTAACIGREFSYELLTAISPLTQAALDDALERLLEAGIVFRQGGGGATGFVFKHALIQDVAYETLLLSNRRRVHARIAQALEQRFTVFAGTESERLARHYTAADMAEQAIRHWLAAGRKALSRWSLPEAVSHLSKALELTAALEDALERAERELEARTALAAATMALHGWPARSVRDVVEPACDLFERGYGGPDAFVNLWNLWVHHGCRAEHREGLSVVDRMLGYSDKRGDPVLALISSFTAAIANFWVGNYKLALAHERAALGLYDFDRDKDLVWPYNHDPKNSLLSWASGRAWAMGYPDQARALSEEAVAHARRVGHPWNLCWTLSNSTFALSNSGDCQGAYSRLEEARCIADEQELAFMTAYMVPVNLGLAAAQDAKYEVAYEEGARAEEIWGSVGGRFWSPVVRAYMARACLNLGRPSEATELIDGAIEQIKSTGEFMYAEEIYRVAGQVCLSRDRNQDGALDLFRKSLDYSKKHGTRSFELRTSMCIARTLREQGKVREARDILAPLYDWFTEGFDTVDLRDARTLLDELSVRPV